MRELQRDDYYSRLVDVFSAVHELSRLVVGIGYAFGLRKAATAGTNNYLYNGKELQDAIGQYDYSSVVDGFQRYS